MNINEVDSKKRVKDRPTLSYLGECFTQLKLARMKFKLFKVPPGFFYDFLGENGCKIEVKTALPSQNKKVRGDKEYKYEIWQFRLSSEKQQNADFFVCVIMESLDKEPIGSFIFPCDKINALETSGMLFVFKSDILGNSNKINKINKYQFFNNWDLILNFKR